MQTLPEPAERPRSISLIGWTTLVLSVLLASKAFIDIAVWKAMGPAVPALMRISRDPSANLPYVRTILAHLTEIKLAQALLWIGVASIGVALLRLRPWARVAMQAVGGCGLLYFAGLLAVWARAWSAEPIDPSVPRLSENSRLTLLAGGITIFLVLGGIVVAMILVLRRPRIQEAFDTAAR
ncbi:MAG: hypothetical protein M3167_03975 [Acidobacteriota bacterium]|nr:hypothetical protein [Acidobacteriota bacterium]